MRHYFATAIAATALLASCSGSGDSDVTRRDSAENLKAEIETAMKEGNYAQAINAIDSFAATFPLETDIRRELLGTRAKAVEGLTLSDIPAKDNDIATMQAAIAEMEQDFVTLQPSSALAPYLIYSGVDKDVTARPALQARVNTGDDALDTPWTLAVNAGRNIGLNRLTIKTVQGATYTIDLPVSDGTMASASPESVADLARQLAEQGDAITTATASGAGGSVNIAVNARQSESIGAAWRLATQKNDLRNALIEREKMERRLQIARDQAANSPAAN